jgi:hypothetical protein
MPWKESDYITKDEWDLIKLLRPSDGTVRTINTDHNGDVHMLIRWPKAYVDEQRSKIEELKLSPEDQKLVEEMTTHRPVEEESQIEQLEVHYCEQHRRYEYN